jgi:aspartyl/asparaginyl-tRNA synthetase
VNERQIALASLLLALFGLAVIFLSTKGMKAKEVQISELGSKTGEYVEVAGFVSGARISRENVFLTLCSGDCVTVAVFKSVAKGMGEPNPYLIKNGERLTVRGEVQEYNGEPELVVIRDGDIESG